MSNQEDQERGAAESILERAKGALGGWLRFQEEAVPANDGARPVSCQCAVLGRGMILLSVHDGKNGVRPDAAVSVTFVFGTATTAGLKIFMTRSLLENACWEMSYARDAGKNARHWVAYIECQEQFMLAIGLEQGQMIRVNDARAHAIMSELAPRMRW